MIGLMDCNNFFVSCERLFRPDLEGKPVAVLSSNDGCIVARSQEVKDIGIAMGVPLFQVKDICQEQGVVLFSGNHTLYRDISKRVMQVLEKEVGDIEVYSIDEAFFRLTDDVTIEDVHTIRNVVVKNVGIPVSIGVATTKTLAKQASGIGKKGNGVSVLHQKEWEKRANDVKCGEIWGLGKQTVTKLSQMGVKTARNYMTLERNVVTSNFGVAGERIYDELHGVSVKPIEIQHTVTPQSIASTKSFKNLTTNSTVLESAIAQHITSCAEKLRKQKLVASRLSVQIQTDRFGDFLLQGGVAEIVLQEPTASTTILIKEALRQMRDIYTAGVPYKKAGVSVSGLMPEAYVTDTLFEGESTPYTSDSIDTIIDELNKKFGKESVHSAVIQKVHQSDSSILRSPAYTTLWKDIPIARA